MSNLSSPQSTRSVLTWIASFLAPYRSRVIGAVFFLMLGSLSWLALGQGVKLIVDDGFLTGNASRLDQMMLVILAITFVSGIATFFRFYLMSWLGERVSADIRIKVYQQLLHLSPTFYAKERTGEVISRFTADTTLLQTVVGSSLSMALRSAVSVTGGLIMMAVTSLTLTGLVLLAVPVVLVPIGVLGRKVRQLARVSQDKVADLGSHVDETLHEIRTVQSYGHEEADSVHFSSRVEAVMSAARLRIRYRASLMASVVLLSIVAIILVTWLGALNVLDGSLTAGQLSAFMFYALLVAGGVATISEVIGDIQRAAGATERLIELSRMQSDIQDPVSPVDFPVHAKGNLTFSDVSFTYPGDENLPVFLSLSFDVKAGERVALVGPSGAGKSSVFTLLQRFFDIQQGQTLLDGVPLKDMSLKSLRDQFALVPQESVIFATNVLENVRYGAPDASEEKVIEACKAARAHEFIEALPHGYHTELGERGVRLSGGQKQRISIARAILADRPILLLDEATSALDAVSEHQVKQALDTLMEGKTSLVIAHRLATVVNADRILVLDDGQLVASGSHQELMETSALYREFASLQLVASESNMVK
ncbi:ABC transporter permease [Enterovibrio norvegicus]|uniref:ATP-binding cassette, subfamily B n=2 Tax=Enterovibrio norvegicus TaxID=188144 RepID=A0A1I5SYW0_9GAMM|nr:ABC transporter transmembrane domain-containing protein [Enterovibrio norvegicus]OEF50121.1 ABC transporter permease [Enterovibrio norvegicus]OEF58523.1 ABC transporter permease [Enterovibrio norvegicus]SFP75965.1 ATP-binding cassette, subfamily B [Enterovibrio norvegicus DSM 15893]